MLPLTPDAIDDLHRLFVWWSATEAEALSPALTAVFKDWHAKHFANTDIRAQVEAARKALLLRIEGQKHSSPTGFAIAAIFQEALNTLDKHVAPSPATQDGTPCKKCDGRGKWADGHPCAMCLGSGKEPQEKAGQTDDPTKPPCPNCKGTGFIDYIQNYSAPCQLCGGRGHLLPVKQEPAKGGAGAGRK